MRVAERIRRHPVLTFFLLTYAVNIAACAAVVAINGAMPDAPTWPLWGLGIFSPTIGAVIMAAGLGGRSELGRLAARLRLWRIGWRWFLVGTVFTLIPIGLAVVNVVLGGRPAGLEAGLTLGTALVALGYTLVAGPLSEESGWRGFALPRLEERHSALSASLILGTVWAFWHVPFYFLPNNVMIPFPIFVPQCIVLAILFTMIFNNTGGSVVATMNAHFGFNFSGAWLAGHLGILPPMLLYVGGSLLAAILVVIVLLVEGPRTLSRRPVSELPFTRQASATA
jgi:membrane protease YdiL (CAAX protease family)